MTSAPTTNTRKKFIILIQFSFVWEYTPGYWWAIVEAESRDAVRRMFSKALDDKRLMLCMLMDDSDAANGLDGPHYFKEYGIEVAPEVIWAVEDVPRWPDDFTPDGLLGSRERL